MTRNTILSLRIPEPLKNTLALRAKAEGKSLAEYARSVLEEAQAEGRSRQAGEELAALNTSAEAFSRLVDRHGSNYEMRARELTSTAERFGSSVKTAIARLEDERDGVYLLQTVLVAGVSALIGGAVLLLGLYFMQPAPSTEKPQEHVSAPPHNTPEPHKRG